MLKKVHEPIKADLAVSGALLQKLEFNNKKNNTAKGSQSLFLQQVIHEPFEKFIFVVLVLE